jgi:hypothetical protein
MRWLITSILVVCAFLTGLQLAKVPLLPKSPHICLQFSGLSDDDMQDYLSLKDQKSKFEKANEILAKIMQIFIADMGLHAANEPMCRMNVTEFPIAAVAPAPSIPAPQAEKPKEKPEAQPSKLGITLDPAKALYQAILWRAEDEKGGLTINDRYRTGKWSAYFHEGRRMLHSPEFFKKIEPTHTPQQIINHMYAVYFGRCAFPEEIRRQLDALSQSNGAGRVFENIVNDARETLTVQIEAGGFSPSTCSN